MTELKYREEQWYLRAAVRDYGPGFSPGELKYADQEFYSGDKAGVRGSMVVKI